MTATTATPRIGQTTTKTLTLLDQVMPEVGDTFLRTSEVVHSDRLLTASKLVTLTIRHAFDSLTELGSRMFVGIPMDQAPGSTDRYFPRNDWKFFTLQDQDADTYETHFIECNADGEIVRGAEPQRFTLVNPKPRVGDVLLGLFREANGAGRTAPVAQVMNVTADSLGEMGLRRVILPSGLLSDEGDYRFANNSTWVTFESNEYHIPAPFVARSYGSVTNAEKAELMGTDLVVDLNLSLVPPAEAQTGIDYLIRGGDTLRYGRMDNDGDLYDWGQVMDISEDGSMFQASARTDYNGVNRNEARLYLLPAEWRMMDSSRSYRIALDSGTQDLSRQLVELAERWEKMDEALNELADEKDYCSEFEESVIPLGFSGREDQEVDFSVDVDVEWSVEVSLSDDSKMGHLANILGAEYGIGSATVKVEGTSSVNVSLSGMNPNSEGDDLENQIDSQMLRDALNFDSDVSVDIDDYNVTDWEQQ